MSKVDTYFLKRKETLSFCYKANSCTETEPGRNRGHTRAKKTNNHQFLGKNRFQRYLISNILAVRLYDKLMCQI